MIDGTDLISLEQDCRKHIGEETARFWTQADVFQAINAEVMRLARKVIALDSGYFEAVVTPTPAASYDLPVNCFLVRNVQFFIGNTWTSPLPINDHARGNYQTYGTSSTYPYAWRIQDNTIYIENGIGDATQMRICYARLPAKLRYESVASTAAASITISSGANTDDAYNGDRIIVLSGTGSGQIKTVTDYTASSYTLTSTTWTTPLDTTSYISWLLPEPLAKYPDVVATGAAVRLLFRRRDSELIQTISAQYERDLVEMLEALDQRQTMVTERGNFLPDWGDE